MEVETKKFGLLDLPQELVLYSCDRESLENTIKNALLLKNTCTYFHTLLSPTDVGKFCKSRDITEKNQEMKKLLSFMYDENYWNIRNAALMLVHAGADNAAGDYQGFSLLKNAIDQKDKEMITILFDNNTNPNQKNGQWPDWFYIRDVDIAQMFINHKVDLQIETDNEPNILWFLVDYAMCYPPFELIEFYVKNKCS